MFEYIYLKWKNVLFASLLCDVQLHSKRAVCGVVEDGINGVIVNKAYFSFGNFLGANIFKVNCNNKFVGIKRNFAKLVK